MPRKFKLAFMENSPPQEVFMRKFTREDIYGKRTIERRTEEEKSLHPIFVTLDGRHFLVSGSTSSQYVDINGSYVENVVPSDVEGTPLETVPSMFSLSSCPLDEITTEEFFGYAFQGTYLLDSEEDLAFLLDRCINLLKKGRFLKFQYAYYTTPFPQDAVLIPVEDQIVIVVGTYTPPRWSKLQSDFIEETLQEEELEEETDEFGFEEVW